jgi:hypothetical protein
MARFGDFDQYLQDDGNPLVSGKLYFFETGTTTAKTTYSDINNSIPNTHPVILTASGRQPNVFFDGVAKAILATSSDVQIAVQDPVGETTTDFGDEWVPTKIYTAKDVVIGSDGIFYRSLVNGNQNNNPINTSGSWALLYSVEWDAGITYAIGALVTLDNFQYQSLQSANINQNPSTQTAYWVPLNFAWTATAVYATGQNAVGTDGVLYTSLQDSNTGNVPASSGAYWVGTSAAAAASATASANSATASAASESAAATSATNSATSATASASSATASANSATASAASATAAENFSGATEWVSGTTYAVGIVVWSPINYLPYRRIIAGAGTTDPSADSTNWIALAAEVTLGTLTKTFTTGEASTITLSSAVTAGAPVVSVSKEVPQTGVSNGNWDVNSTTENYTQLDSAPATTLDWGGNYSVGVSTLSSGAVGTLTESSNLSGGVAIGNNGTKLYAIFANDTIYQYSLSVANDPSTATYDSISFSVAAQTTQACGLAISTDGTKIYIGSGTQELIFEYSLSTAFDVSSASYTSNSVSMGYTVLCVNFSPDGTQAFTSAGVESVRRVTLSTAWDLSTAGSSAFTSLTYESFGIAFSSDGAKLYAITTGKTIYEYPLSTAFDITTFSTSTSNLASGVAETVTGFSGGSTTGSLYVVTSSDEKVTQFAFPLALALGTGSFTSADVGKTIEANSGAFVLTATSGTYVETTAPTSYAQVASGDWEMYGVVYNTVDGDLQLSGTTGAIVSGYNAVHTTASIDSTYWTDINSMTADQAAGDGTINYCISTDDRTTWGIVHNTSGERDIVRNNAGTWQYNSNGTYASETWVAGATNTELATIAEAMGTAQNRMGKTQLDAVTDANHIVLGNDLDLAIVFNLASGTTVPSSDGVAINYDANVLNKLAVVGTDYDADFPATDKVRITALSGNNLKVRVL